MKATVLIDNTARNGLAGEWGLSFYIEYEDKKILLDAGGESGLFAQNAGKLGLSLKDVDYAVLSHAHYDHADGMSVFFEHNDTARLYLKDTCRENCYKQEPWGMKYIGIKSGMLSRYRSRLAYVAGDCQLSKGVWLISHSTPDLEQAGEREHMYLKEGDSWKADCFSHEQSLVFETEEGVVIFNSCSHGGADNIIREISAVFPHRKIRAMIGGFHLFNKSGDYVQDFADRVRATGVEMIYTGHCTGEEGFRILRDALGGMVRQLEAGLEIVL